ncbi:hypothetical protein BJX70DRAFT_207418 [Aspergillus crustosus]
MSDPKPGSRAFAGPRGTRRRAPQACLQCRKRKVRCDVALKGQPCSNCAFDRAPCEVKQRQQRRQSFNFSIRPPTDNIPSPLAPTSLSTSDSVNNIQTPSQPGPISIRL